MKGNRSAQTNAESPLDKQFFWIARASCYKVINKYIYLC